MTRLFTILSALSLVFALALAVAWPITYRTPVAVFSSRGDRATWFLTANRGYLAIGQVQKDPKWNATGLSSISHNSAPQLILWN